MSKTPNKFYLTTPIYYVNARPHIGHAYSTIAADVIARRHRLLGEDTFFLTGTDEHGQKVQRSAEAAGIPPQQFADQVSASFSNLWKRMGITNDDFIRTTDERHKRGVQHLWRELESNGAIYLSSYTGQYCVSEETFVDGPPGTIGPDGKPTETVTEENYFFRLSDYQQPLIDLIESGTLHIQPETAKNEVLSFLRGNLAHSDIKEGNVILSGARSAESKDLRFSAAGNPYVPGTLKDLSISRTSFTWGIPVPSSNAVILSEAKNPRISPDASQKPTESHVVYVWLDALANYITAMGYGAEDRDDLTAAQKQEEQAKFARYWPANVHLVGKEITRFHCVYWPAFLLALNPATPTEPGAPRLDSETWVPDRPQLSLEQHRAWAAKMLPKSVVANGWLLFEESKMSKSRGNVVRTETILDAFGPLCPPVPASVSFPSPPTSGLLDSTGLQPGELGDKSEGALAPGTSLSTPPTKAQQDLFAADVLRYFLLREIPFGQDGTFSFDALITRYNADLANGYGNLVSRVMKMICDYFAGIIPNPPNGPLGEQLLQGFEMFKEGKLPQGTDSVRSSAINNQRAYTEFLEDYNFSIAVSAPLASVGTTDGYVSAHEPWKLAKQTDTLSRQKLSEILYTAAESIRIITALLYPILPYATASVWQQLGLGSIEQAARNGDLKDLQWGGLQPGTKLGPLAPIFPRADKGLAQIMTDMENPTTPAANTDPSAPAQPAAPAPTAESSEPTAEALNAVNPTASASPVAPQTADPEPGPSTITIDDFAKVDLRVAQIVVAERIPKADKLLRLEVDLGSSFDPPRRQILAGIAEHYAPETLIGRKVVIVANLAPRKMRGLESQGMLVAASLGDHGRPSLAGFLEEVELGARLR